MFGLFCSVGGTVEGAVCFPPVTGLLVAVRGFAISEMCHLELCGQCSSVLFTIILSIIVYFEVHWRFL